MWRGAELVASLKHLYTSLYGLSASPDIIFERLVAAKEAFARQCFDLVCADHVWDPAGE